MNKKSRIVSLILVVFITAALFAGCGEKKDSDIETITFWSASGGGKKVYSELINEFNNTIGKENKMYVETVFKEGDMKEQVELAYSTGQAPDVFSTSGIEKYAENGQIAAIEDMPGGKELLESYKSSLIENTHTYKGKTYCLPIGTTTYGLVYNKDLFKKAGIVDKNGNAKPPKTMDELVDCAKRLTDKSKKQYGIIFPFKFDFIEYELNNMVQASYGHDEYNPLTGKYDFSVYKDILNIVSELKRDGSIYPGAENIDNDAARARFAEGNVGMKFAVSWDVGVLNDQFPAKCDWGVAPAPVADKDNCYLQKMKTGSGPYINKHSLKTKSAEKIMTFYKWYYSLDVEKKIYEQGITLPYHAEILDEAELKTEKKGWKDFAELIKISKTEPVAIKYDLGNTDSFTKLFINEFWQGKSSAEEIIEKANKNYNDGVARYKENNPEYNGDSFILTEWDVS